LSVNGVRYTPGGELEPGAPSFDGGGLGLPAPTSDAIKGSKGGEGRSGAGSGVPDPEAKVPSGGGWVERWGDLDWGGWWGV